MFMFYQIMKICSALNNQICFKGFNESTYLSSDTHLYKNEYNHTTSFFRNKDTLDFTTGYCLKKFPHGTEITEFGCSQGQKGYSLMMNLDANNKNKQYKYHGYDIKLPIEATNEPYKIEFERGYEYLIKLDKKIRAKFFEFFREEKDLSKSDNEIFVTPQKTKVADIMQFSEGNILDIKKIIPPKKSGIVIFQNALYHLLNNEEATREENLKTVDKLFKDIYSVLPEKGIFVLGSLPADHMYDYTHEKKTFFARQNGKTINVSLSTEISKLLAKNGFEPIFYEKIPEQSRVALFKEVYLPSVWQKACRLA